MMNISTRTRESAIVWFDYAYLMMIHCDEYQDEAVRARTREPAIVQLLMQLFEDDTFFYENILISKTMKILSLIMLRPRTQRAFLVSWPPPGPYLRRNIIMPPGP